MKKIIVFAIIIIVSIGGIFLGNTILKSSKKPVFPIAHESKAPRINNSSSTNEEIFTPGIPQRIEIPNLGVNTIVEQVGKDSEGRMDIPKDWNNTGWYKYGPKPGEKGNAAIDGHVDTPQGKPSVFANLTKLKNGDQVIITDDKNQRIIFEVTGIERYNTQSVPTKRIFDKTGQTSHLNLITCGGIWNRLKQDYSERIVAYTKLSDPIQ